MAIAFNQKKLATVAKKYRINLLYLFGSSARNDRHAGSDVDIAYYSEQPLNFDRQMDLARALSRLPFLPSGEIDLVSLRSAPPLLRYQILNEGKKLFGGVQADDRFYRSTLKSYIDAKPLLSQTSEYVHRRAALPRPRSLKK